MSKWFDIFKTGVHTDSKGNKHIITQSDLQTVENKFAAMKDDVALCVGHPKTNSPAYGWLKKVKVFGDKLRGMAEDVVPEFADAVNKRMFKKISISLKPDLRLNHVGFLGATLPAVKGLENVPVGCFAEEPGDFTIEFSEDELNFSDGGFTHGKIRTLGYIMQKLRDLIIEKYGPEAADKTVNQYDIDFLKEDPPEDPGQNESAIQSFNEPITPERGKEDKSMKEKDKPETSGAEKTEDFAEKVTTLTSENDRLRQENETLKKGKIEGEVKNFVESLTGKLLPKFKQGITEILVDLKGSGLEINFSETVKKPAFETMQDFLESVPVQIPTKEVGAPGTGEVDGSSEDFAEVETDPDRLELHKKAKAISDKEKIPYADAVRRVMKGGN